MSRQLFYIGTSGYDYKFWGADVIPQPLRTLVRNFYPESIKTKERLPFYLDKLGSVTDSYSPSVEINCTRYRKLTPLMCKRWASTIPRDCKITIKAPTWITHGKKLNDFEEWWMNDFKPCLDELGDKLCSVLFQFPPVFKYSKTNVKKIVVASQVINREKVDCAFEFRDVEWYEMLTRDESLVKIFESEHCTPVILDVPEIRDHKTNFGNLPGGLHGFHYVGKRFVYLRFHGTTNYSYGAYGYDYLSSIADVLSKDPKVKKVCWYFNNTDTWEFELPEYKNAIGLTSFNSYKKLPIDRSIIPSCIFDCLCLREFLR